MLYCIKCQKDVEPIKGKIYHPDLGWTEMKVCPAHTKMPLRVKGDEGLEGKVKA